MSTKKDFVALTPDSRSAKVELLVLMQQNSQEWLQYHNLRYDN
ncbi:MAG: hypothetical protein ACL7AY_03125 [Candidatus Arsenophonus phytopathogenicus]